MLFSHLLIFSKISFLGFFFRNNTGELNNLDPDQVRVNGLTPARSGSNFNCLQKLSTEGTFKAPPKMCSSQHFLILLSLKFIKNIMILEIACEWSALFSL